MESKNEIFDESRRHILKKAYVAPAIIALGSMTLNAKSSGSSSLHRDNGWGNGDHHAPGKSLRRNRAENFFKRRRHRKFGISNPG